MTHILIDGDILIYQAASSVEQDFNWGDDLWSVAADMGEAKQLLQASIAEIEGALGATKTTLAVSANPTFRSQIWPAYKGNRKARKPVVFRELREWSVRELGAIRWSLCEADDVLGILATRDPEAVVVTVDKDLKGVPGRHWNPSKRTLLPVTVTQAEADEWHLIQSMAGDPTDGYAGIPGIGPVKAKKLLDKNGCSWETVVDAYKAADMTPEDAILNARLAKILTQDLWDEQRQLPILWTPR